MESARRGLQIVRFAMLLSIVLYFIIATRIPAHVAPNPLIFRVLALLAVANLGLVLFFRTIFVRSPAEVLRSSPQDSSALAKWKSGQVLTWAFAESDCSLWLSVALPRVSNRTSGAVLFCRSVVNRYLRTKPAGLARYALMWQLANPRFSRYCW